MSVFECQTISENIHKLKQEEFKDFQDLYEPCIQCSDCETRNKHH
jgi:CO dehydrogenase/acetyl-CoA synthase alpha subunit